MNDNEIADILRYSKPNELYFVGLDNILNLILCPFKVMVLHEIGFLKYGQILYVTEIKVTRNIRTVYMIDNTAYFYYYFDILDE